MILLIAITIAGSESDDLILNQSGNEIDQASTVNHLRNTFPDGLASLVVGFWNSLEFFFWHYQISSSSLSILSQC